MDAAHKSLYLLSSNFGSKGKIYLECELDDLYLYSCCAQNIFSGYIY